MSGEAPRGRRAIARALLLLLRETVSNYREGTGSRSPRHRSFASTARSPVDRQGCRSRSMGGDERVTLVRRIARVLMAFLSIRKCENRLKSLTRDTGTFVSRSDPIAT
jgi:hypothetical protein